MTSTDPRTLPPTPEQTCTSCGHLADSHIDHGDGRGAGCMAFVHSPDIRGGVDECGCLFAITQPIRRYCVCVETENGAPVGFIRDPDCPDHGERS